MPNIFVAIRFIVRKQQQREPNVYVCLIWRRWSAQYWSIYFHVIGNAPDEHARTHAGLYDKLQIEPLRGLRRGDCEKGDKWLSGQQMNKLQEQRKISKMAKLLHAQTLLNINAGISASQCRPTVVCTTKHCGTWTDLCIPVSKVSARQHFRSTTRRFLVVPRCRLSTLGPRAFSVAGPSLWNSLSDSLREE